MPTPLPSDTPNHPARVGRSQSFAEILGCDTGGAIKRRTLTGNYAEPRLEFPERMKWLAKVQHEIAESSARSESYPHKVAAVARALAYVGTVCRPSIEQIAAKAGCVPNTVKACIAWLEERGALTWSHTARRHSNGRMVRSSNLYTLILNFRSMVATVARAMRAIWRERPRVLSKGNECLGVTQQVTFTEHFDARRHLAAVARQRQDELGRLWQARHAT
jgi:hypothetical protein